MIFNLWSIYLVTLDWLLYNWLWDRSLEWFRLVFECFWEVLLFLVVTGLFFNLLGPSNLIQVDVLLWMLNRLPHWVQISAWEYIVWSLWNACLLGCIWIQQVLDPALPAILARVRNMHGVWVPTKLLTAFLGLNVRNFGAYLKEFSSGNSSVVPDHILWFSWAARTHYVFECTDADSFLLEGCNLVRKSKISKYYVHRIFCIKLFVLTEKIVFEFKND